MSKFKVDGEVTMLRCLSIIDNGVLIMKELVGTLNKDKLAQNFVVTFSTAVIHYKLRVRPPD